MGEIELLRNLHHPNIVEYIGSFKTRSHLYIIMVRMLLGNGVEPAGAWRSEPRRMLQLSHLALTSDCALY